MLLKLILLVKLHSNLVLDSVICQIYQVLTTTVFCFMTAWIQPDFSVFLQNFMFIKNGLPIGNSKLGIIPNGTFLTFLYLFQTNVLQKSI